MAIQDFLITFRADTGQALTAINALYQRVQQVDAQLNRAMGRVSTTGVAGQFRQMASGATQAATATGKLYDRIEDFNIGTRKSTSSILVADKAVTRLAQRYIGLKDSIRLAQSAGIPVSPATYDKTIMSLEALRGRAGLADETINGLQHSLRQQRAATGFAKDIGRLNTEFKRLDAVMGRAGGMTPQRIRDQRAIIQELNKFTDAGVLGSDPRVGRMGPIIEEQFRRLPPQISAATASLVGFNKTVEEQIRVANTFKTPLPSATRVANAFQNTLNVLRTPGIDPKVYAEAARQGEVFAGTLRKFPAGLNEASRAFGTHARRIAEGILLYDLMGRSIQAVAGQIKLVGDLAREQIRFEAVIGGDVNNDRFLQEIGQVAVQTNTELADLASIMDTVAFATTKGASAAQREAEALQLMNLAGMQTNVTQRGLALETENLLGIMNVFGLGVDGVGDALGRITVMGGNSSTAISAITDVISASGRAAKSAGFDFDLLGSLGSEMFRALRGSMSGGEIGNMFNTIFGRLAKPEVQRNIEEISNGLIQFRDEFGNLRVGDEVFVELFAAIEAGVIPSQQAAAIINNIIPPLNPAAESFVKTMQRILPDALGLAARAGQATEEQLEELNALLVSGPAEQFAISVKALEVAFTAMLDSGIIGGMETLATLFKALADILTNEFGGSVAGVAIQLAAFFTAFRALQYIGKGLGVFFLGRKALDDLAIAASNAGVQGYAASGKLASMGGPIGAVTTKLSGLARVFATLARSLAVPLTIFIAIELLNDIPDIVNGIKGQLDDEMRSGLVDKDTLNRAFGAMTTPDVFGIDLDFLSDIATGSPLFGDDIYDKAFGRSSDLTDIQEENVVNLARAMTTLKEEGKLTAESQKILDAAIKGAGNTVKGELVTYEEIIGAYNESKIASFDAAEGTDECAQAQEDARIAAENATDAIDSQNSALLINAGLSEARAVEIERLTAALASGAITVDEFTDGQSNLSSASDAASAWIAAYGDQLSLLPGLQERVARTGDTAAEALLGMLLSNPDTIDARIDWLNFMVELEEANKELTDSLTENPIVFSVETQRLMQSVNDVKIIFNWLTSGTYETKRVLSDTPLEPMIALERLKAQAEAALKIYRTLLLAGSAFNKAHGSTFQAANPEVGQAARAGSRQAGSNVNALDRAIAELEAAGKSLSGSGGELGAAGAAWGELGGIRGDDPRLGTAADSAREPQQTSIIDIGDLSPASIGQLIAIATAAQGRVVAAGGVVDDDETVALFKDAMFQRLIAGIDQRFLQQAIEELTDVERKRLELEQARLQDVTRSIVSQVGPIQSLTSAPVLAAGGGLLTGQGFNADPRLGNITINVPINWSGMNLSQLQEYIYSSISQAWIDAGRGA